MSRQMSHFSSVSSNPLMQDFTTLHGIPPFAEIQTAHFAPAIDAALKGNLEEIREISANVEEPSFENTIAAIDRNGRILGQVRRVFENLCLSASPPELQEVQMATAGPLASHESSIYMWPGLFQRVDCVYNARNSPEWNLNSEQVRLVERIHLQFVRAGAKFDSSHQERYSAIVTKLAELTTQFGQNVMADEASHTIVLSQDDLSGLPSYLVDAAKQAAVERNEAEGSYVITLSRSLVVPFLTYSDRADLRENAWRAWTRRGELCEERDNKKIIVEVLALREEQAAMHGYDSYAEYATADTMAGTPRAVMDLLERVWSPAKESVGREKAMLLEAKIASGDSGDMEPWDWRYWAEKVRQTKYDLDESEVKQYFTLEHMVEAVFDCAHRLFGLTFVHRPDIVSYHPDVKTYEVFEQEKLVGIFLHDNYARQHKQSGAWMSAFRCQSRNDSAEGHHILPIIVNNNNFAKGEPTLLSYDDARTLFHEFGHGMHGMLSNVTYQTLAGTNVLRDFVELPSQLFEHWLSVPEILKKHALHHQTGESIPDSLLAKLTAARKFNQGFESVEYTSSALVDQALHCVKSVKTAGANGAPLDVTVFEQQELQRLGMPREMVMRHRPAHFQHLFSGADYASAYYVYLWAEVLDADGFDAFLETGNAFDAATAARVRQFIYSSGNTLDPAEAFRRFRGRDPVVEPMLKKKGLLMD